MSTTTEPTEAHELSDRFTTVEVPLRVRLPDSDGWQTVPTMVLAQRTNTPGLCVVPRVTRQGFTGMFDVVHTGAGLAVPLAEHNCVDVNTALRVADGLADVGVDWTTDRDNIVALMQDTEVAARVFGAIHAAKYPPSDGHWDGDDTKPLGAAGWPNTAEQATANQLAARYTRSALQRHADMWELSSWDIDDKPAMQVFVSNASAMIGEYNTVHLLRRLAELDPAAADHAARELWEAAQAGDGYGEWLAQWGLQYGIDVPEARQVPGTTPPPALDVDAVYNTPLEYEEHGTVGELRQAAAQLAVRGQRRFSELMTDQRLGEGPLSDEQADESLVAHGCSFYGWSLVAVLGWLAREFPHLAIRAARMVDDIGTNGGNEYCDDITTDSAADAGATETEAVAATEPAATEPAEAIDTSTSTSTAD